MSKLTDYPTWDALPAVRVPGEIDDAELFHGWKGYRSDDDLLDDLTGMTYLQVEDWVYANLTDPVRITEALWEALQTRDADNPYWEQTCLNN